MTTTKILIAIMIICCLAGIGILIQWLQPLHYRSVWWLYDTEMGVFSGPHYSEWSFSRNKAYLGGWASSKESVSIPNLKYNCFEYIERKRGYYGRPEPDGINTKRIINDRLSNWKESFKMSHIKSGHDNTVIGSRAVNISPPCSEPIPLNIELGCKAEFSEEQGVNNIIPGLGEEVSHPVWRIYNGKLQPYAPDVFTDPQKYKENLKHPLKEINGKYYRVNLMDGVAIGDREIPGMPMGRKPKSWGEDKK